MNKNYQICSVLNQNPKAYGKNGTRGKTYKASSIKHFFKRHKLNKGGSTKWKEHMTINTINTIAHNTIVPRRKDLRFVQRSKEVGSKTVVLEDSVILSQPSAILMTCPHFPEILIPVEPSCGLRKSHTRGECELWTTLQHHMATPFLISSFYFFLKLRESPLALASHACFRTGTADIHHHTQLLVKCYCFWYPLVILTVSTDSDFQISSAPLPG